MPGTDINPPSPGETVVRRKTTTGYAKKVPWLLLKSAPGAKIRVDGHTAARKGGGNKVTQQNFSEKRAEAVKARLVELGISDAQISTKGFGAGKPTANRNTPEGPAANRRVEIKVL